MATAPKLTPDVCLDVNRFVLETGRMPRLGDPVPPWKYRGWLLFQTQVCDFNPAAPQRWPYYLRTIEAGRLLDEPIPRVDFTDGCSGGKFGTGDGFKMIRKALDILFNERGAWDSMRSLIDWLGYGMATAAEEPRLSDDVQEKLYRHWNLEPLLTMPHDYFGTLISEGKGSGKSWNPTAFFPTPHNVCEMMTRMVMADLEWRDGEATPRLPDGRDARLATVCDPCTGTGRFLLHASNYSVCLYGMDIDPLVCAATRINSAMYAPWIAFPFPAHILDATGVPLGVECRDALRDPPVELIPKTPHLVHRDVPRPPAPLPIAQAHEYRSAGIPMYRVDDRGQGLLYDDLFAQTIGDESDVDHS